MIQTPSDEEAAREILRIFMEHRVSAGGALQRINFFKVRDAHFQRGMNKAVEIGWIKRLRDRYKYELTEAGFAEASLLK
jgi:hypothetical protein